MNFPIEVLIEVLTVYQGIIGAIGGVVATMLVTHLLKKAGKVYIHSNKHKFEFRKRDELGGYTETTWTEAESGYLNLELYMFNSTEIPKSFRDILIKIYDKNNCLIFSAVPKDEKTRREVAAATWRDDLVLINLPPKKMVHYQLHVSLSEEVIKRFDECASIHFEARDHKGKIMRRSLKMLN